MKRSALLSIAAAAALAAPSAARADLTYIGPVSENGGGLGNQFTLLTLQSPGNASIASGCVSPLGIGIAGGCGFPDLGIMTGASQTQVQLLSQPELSGLTGQTLRLVYNGTEPGNDPSNTLTGLVLTLYSGNTAIFSASYPGVPQTFATFSGVGNLGYLFGLTASQAADFDAARAGANGPLSIGLGASLANAEGGLETFALAVAPGRGVVLPGPGTVVPEPGTWALLGTGLLAVGGIRVRRRTRA